MTHPTTKLPKGPPSAILQQLRYMRDPFKLFRDCRDRYGDPFYLPGLECGFVVTGEPEGLRTIFGADPGIYDPVYAELMAPLIGENSILIQTGDRHRAMRKLQAPPFHSARMKAYGALIRDLTLARLNALPRGQPFSAHHLTQSLSLDVIIQAVFGVTDRSWMDRFSAAMTAFVGAMHRSFIVFRFLRVELGGLTPYARFRRTQDQVHRMLDEAIAARRAAPEDRPDILGMLLAARYEDGAGMSDTEIRDHLLTLVIAGHETTALALQWALYELHHTPGPLERLRAELDAAGDGAPEAMAQRPYLQAVCDETLRLWPISPSMTRKLKAPLELLGYTVPAGQAVSASIYLAHRREEAYPDPERFRPERFLDRTFSPFEFLPFGGGARRCLGAAFAAFEMRVVLATLVRAARFRLHGDPAIRVVARNAIVGPSRPIQLALE